MHRILAADFAVGGFGFIAILLGVAILLALQIWALVDTSRRGRKGWCAAIYVTFPIGAITWLAYGRRRSAA